MENQVATGPKKCNMKGTSKLLPPKLACANCFFSITVYRKTVYHFLYDARVFQTLTVQNLLLPAASWERCPHEKTDIFLGSIFSVKFFRHAFLHRSESRKPCNCPLLMCTRNLIICRDTNVIMSPREQHHMV